MIHKAHSKGKLESHFVSKVKEERSRNTSGSNITDTSTNCKKKKIKNNWEVYPLEFKKIKSVKMFFSQCNEKIF